MEQMDTHSRRIRWALFAVATVAIVATVVTCRSTTDEVLAPRAEATDAKNCMSNCAHEANEAIHEENDRHDDALEACHDDKACKEREQARHKAAMDQIQDQRKECQNNCHHQGKGKGH